MAGNAPSVGAESPIQQLQVSEQGLVNVTAERFGCGARTPGEKRACALYLWLLGPTTTQLSVACPCQA